MSILRRSSDVRTSFQDYEKIRYAESKLLRQNYWKTYDTKLQFKFSYSKFPLTSEIHSQLSCITMMMEAVGTPDTSVYSNESTRRHIPEGSNLQLPRRPTSVLYPRHTISKFQYKIIQSSEWMRNITAVTFV
jgi:hypothetical protein